MTEPPPPNRPTPGDPYPGPQPSRPHYPGDPYGSPASAYPQYGGWGEPVADPRHPGPAYPPQGPPPRASRLGARLLRRPLPPFSIVLAGAGAALLLVGAFVLAAQYYGDGVDVTLDDSGLGGSGGGSRRFLGVVLFLAITAAGYAAAIVRQRGPVATAGAVAAAFGVPLTIGFLTLDASDLFRGQYPFSVDAVFLLSIGAWLADYFLVPGLRGRALFLGAAAIWIFGYLALKASGGDSLAEAGGAVFGGTGGGDTGAVTGVGLVFGLTYYAIAAVLDRQGRPGAAVALVVAGFDATVGGVLGGASDMGLAGTGTLLLFLGAGLTWYGAHNGRRFTAWAWGTGFALGFLLIIAKIFDDSYTGGGIAL